MIRCITFDCWDTILMQTDHSIDERRRNLVRKFFFHKNLSDERITAAVAQEKERYLRIFSEEKRTPGLEERLGILVTILYGRKMPDIAAQLAEEIVALIEAVPPILVSGAAESLRALAERYRLGLISNISITPGHLVRKWLTHFHVDHFFSAFTFSNDHHVAKPHPAIFQMTLAQVGVMPSESVHVGDDENLDVQGAHAAGMKAILFSGVIPAPPQSEADLQVNDFRRIPEAIGRLDECLDGGCASR